MLQTVRSLSHVPLFRSLDATAIDRVDRACSWRRAAGKSWIVDYQSGGTEVYFVLQGHVRVIVTLAGTETILRDIGEGEYFGEMAALDGQPRSAGILAVTDATLAIMPASVFRRAIHEHPDVCDQVMGVLVGQIRMLANRANEASGLGMKPRFWAELLRLARPSSASPGAVVISPPPTHAELAARVGSQREAVTKELGSLERAGLVQKRRGAIVLTDPARLRAMVVAAARD